MEEREYGKMAALQRRHWWFRAKRAVVRALLDVHVALPADPRILEVGCGTGAMLSVLAERGRVVALDRFPGALSHLGDAWPVRGDAGRLPFGDGVFDLVACFDVLYHAGVPDVTVALREVARVLTPAGRLVLTDSALPILYGRHDRAHHGARRFTRASMARLLERSGLAPVHLSYYHCAVFPAAFVSRVGGRLLGALRGRREEPASRSQLTESPPGLDRLMSLLYRLEAPLAARWRLPVGVSIVGVARPVPAAAGTGG